MVTPSKHLTCAQNEALHKAWELLCEHFDIAVVIYATEVDASISTTKRELARDVLWHGGAVQALGATTFASASLERVLTT